MKRKRKAASSAYKSQKRLPYRASDQINSQQNERLPCTLSSSASERRVEPHVVNKDCGTSSQVPLPPRFDCVPNRARPRVPIAPTPRFRPFFDVAIRRASPQAASVIDTRISRDAIYQHPARKDILLVSPPCMTCTKHGSVCDRAGWRCGFCSSLGTFCPRGDHWDSFDAVSGNLLVTVDVASDTSAYDSDPRGEQTQSGIGHIPESKSLFWASSVREMQQCDPHFPPSDTSISYSKLGTVSALLLKREKLQEPSRLDKLVFTLTPDGILFESLQTVCNAGMPLRIYILCDEESTSCEVADNSVACVKVFLVGAYSIRCIERQGDLRVQLTMSRIGEYHLDDDDSKADTAPRTSDPPPLIESGQTFLGFRCSSCGRANRKTHFNLGSCLHCSASFLFSNKAANNITLRRRKMELEFTGSRSGLGQANMLLTENDLVKRTVSTFSDGSRVCTYYVAILSESFESVFGMKQQHSQHGLHHILKPGRPTTASIDAFTTPSTLFRRLSLQVELKLRLQGYALYFGTQSCDACRTFAEEQHPFSSASPEVVRLLASLRESLQLASAITQAQERPGRLLGCLFLLLSNSRLKIQSSFFSSTSAHFGILCLSTSTGVTLRRDKNIVETISSITERTLKPVLLGSFILQPQDAIVGRTDLLEAVELELSSNGISLWAIAHFSAAERPRATGDHTALRHPGPLSHGPDFAVHDHRRPWSL